MLFQKKHTVFIAIFTAIFLMESMVLGDDLQPPTWRGDNQTTSARWEFSTNDDTPDPDFEFNTNGASSMTILTGIGQEYLPEWGGRQGIWPLSGAMEVEIPNFDIPNEFKVIWVQLTWAGQVELNPPRVWEKTTETFGTLEFEQILEPTNEPPPVNPNWHHWTYEIVISPNPASETVRIDGAIVVDQVVIDTICIPEPAALGMLGMGGIVLFRRRRK